MAAPLKYENEADRQAAQKLQRQQASRRYYEKNRDLVNERSTTWRAAHLARASMKNKLGEWRRNFGISKDQYDKMFLSQGGVCAICGGPPSGGHEYFTVDHCHLTGRVRGLLCHICNRLLGMLSDDPNLFARIPEYLNG